MEEPGRILVRAPNWLGDLVMSTPGFRALRARFPEARIDALLPAPLAPLLEGAPWFDEVLALTEPRRSTASLFGDARRLRARGAYDLAICIPDSFRSALLLRMAGVRRSVGFRRGGRGPLLQVPLQAPTAWGPKRRVARERFVAHLVEEVGAPVDDLSLELHTSARQEEAAAALFAGAGLAPESALAVLAPGASYGPSKCWPAESFAVVGDRLHERGLEVVVVGSPAEEKLVARVCEAMRAPATPLAGPGCDLGVLKVAMRRAAAVVANDAGARHVAVAFGVPTAVVFGPTDIAKTDANLERVATLWADEVECRPCYERVCPIDHRCMTRVGPAQVLAALDRLESEA